MTGATRTDPQATEAPATPASPILRVDDLKKFYPVRGGVFSTKKADVKAVNGVSFDLVAHVIGGSTAYFRARFSTVSPVQISALQRRQ